MPRHENDRRKAPQRKYVRPGDVVRYHEDGGAGWQLSFAFHRNAKRLAGEATEDRLRGSRDAPSALPWRERKRKADNDRQRDQYPGAYQPHRRHARALQGFCVGGVTDALKLQLQDQCIGSRTIRFGVVSRAPADLLKAIPMIERERRRIRLVNLQEEFGHAEPGQA